MLWIKKAMFMFYIEDQSCGIGSESLEKVGGEGHLRGRSGRELRERETRRNMSLERNVSCERR